MKGFIKVKFYYWHEGSQQEQIESMWTKPVDGNFRIENIPFYVMNFALGDIISVKIVDDELFVDELIEESGNSTIHLVFFDESIIQETRAKLNEMGCRSEISDRHVLIAVNIPASTNYNDTVKPFLENGEEKGLWEYQEACLGQ